MKGGTGYTGISGSAFQEGGMAHANAPGIGRFKKDGEGRWQKHDEPRGEKRLGRHRGTIIQRELGGWE